MIHTGVQKNWRMSDQVIEVDKVSEYFNRVSLLYSYLNHAVLYMPGLKKHYYVSLRLYF